LLSPVAIERFRRKQRQLLHDTYDAAWAAGVAAYEPDDSQRDQATDEQTATLVGLGTAVALLARRVKPYVPPEAPEETRKGRALERALAGVERMTGELATLAPGPGQTLSDAVSSWADSNAYRLDAGDSVAWAGEQNGYGEAANADGMLLEWQTESDERVCQDCEALGTLPPMPEEDWPTTPGSGGTECEVGCRCSLEAAAPPAGILNVDDPGSLLQLVDLTSDDENVLARIAGKAGPSLPALA
jgi:hypothetical protein